MDESIYPHPGVLLSNSSGAYGITIAEHIIMVTLMLLRRMLQLIKAWCMQYSILSPAN